MIPRTSIIINSFFIFFFQFDNNGCNAESVYRQTIYQNTMNIDRINNAFSTHMTFADDINNVSNFIHNFRNGTNMTLESYYHAVTSTEHTFCTLLRDDFCCIGERYIAVLKNTPLFNRKYSMLNMKSGISILLEGNSHLAELVDTWVCESYAFNKIPGNIKVWIEKDSILNNNLYIEIIKPSVKILLIDNDRRINFYGYDMHEHISSLNSSFDIIGVGKLNWLWKKNITVREEYYKLHFPNSTVIPFNETLLPCDCRSDFIYCDQACGHQCSPGPILRAVESFAHMIIKATHMHGSREYIT
jgi:hypothetical protein